MGVPAELTRAAAAGGAFRREPEADLLHHGAGGDEGNINCSCHPGLPLLSPGPGLALGLGCCESTLSASIELGLGGCSEARHNQFKTLIGLQSLIRLQRSLYGPSTAQRYHARSYRQD